MSPMQEQTVIGSLLGDGGLIATGGGKRFRFTITHGQAQKDYLFWKYEILKEFARTPPYYQERTASWKFNTVSTPEFTDLRARFYRGRQKVAPDEAREMIGIPYVLAVWYMDDGNLRRERGKVYGCMLNTQSFTDEDNAKLRDWLHQDHGIHPAHATKPRQISALLWRRYVENILCDRSAIHSPINAL